MPDALTPDRAMQLLTRRYQAAPEALIAVLCPLLVRLMSIDKRIYMAPDTSHLRASFTVQLTQENSGVLVTGRTGKFVPAGFGCDVDAGWREIAKGRITSMDYQTGIAHGEIYLGFGAKGRAAKTALELALEELDTDCFLEIDQYGVAAKALSGLAEYYLVQNLQEHGYEVVRMPEDMAAHLGMYANYDFQVVKDNVRKRLEVKSLWGTNTRFARLIHKDNKPPAGPRETWTAEQLHNYYPTSSCKFATQDFFAVSLFLRTGNIRDLAFARSVSKVDKPYGLPPVQKHPEHVNQNPLCTIGDGTWFASIDEVWDLE